jgi:actinin alpha
LDVEDIVDVPRPDERSVVTYVSEYFHKFAAQDQFEVAGRRIAKAVGLAKTNDELKNNYIEKAQALVDWINNNTNSMKDRNYENTLEDIEKKWEEFRNYKKNIKPQKASEKLDVEATLNSLQAKLRVNNRLPFQPPENLTPTAIDQLWNVMGNEENERSKWIRKELEKQHKIENLASRFWRKASALLSWGEDNKSSLSNTDYGNSLSAVQAKLKNHEGFEANYNNTRPRLDNTLQLGQELINENYHKSEDVKAKMAELNTMWDDVKTKGDERKAGLEKELERQQALESLRLEFATRARALANWIEDAEDTLAEPVRVNSLSAIEESKESFSHFINEFEVHSSEYNDIVELSKKMEAEGIEDNMYSAFTISQLTDKWNKLQQEVNERKEALDMEHQRQQDNENLCQEFAEKIKAFVSWCDEQREELSKTGEGTIQEQLDKLRNKGEQINAKKSTLDELISINHKIEERNITHNPHTDQTIESVTLLLDKLNDLVNEQSTLLEKELLNQSGSRVSEEQLAEFKEAFRQFDKDNSGTLEKHEFKACLQALGQPITDEQLDRLVAELGKKTPGKIVFEEFVDYMISRTEVSDTPQTINNAFKTIAGDKDFVTEQELRRVLDQETVDYLLQNMEKTPNGYNYHTFTQKTYRS